MRPAAVDRGTARAHEHRGHAAGGASGAGARTATRVTTEFAYLRGARRKWWLHPVNERPEGTVIPQFLPLDGVEQTATGYAFQWPAVDGGLTEITIDISPYSESPACPFADCEL